MNDEIKDEPKRVQITADVAANNIGAFLLRQKEDGLWHKDMEACLMYLHRNAKAYEEQKAGINAIPMGKTVSFE